MGTDNRPDRGHCGDGAAAGVRRRLCPGWRHLGDDQRGRASQRRWSVRHPQLRSPRQTAALERHRATGATGTARSAGCTRAPGTSGAQGDTGGGRGPAATTFGIGSPVRVIPCLDANSLARPHVRLLRGREPSVRYSAWLTRERSRSKWTLTRSPRPARRWAAAPTKPTPRSSSACAQRVPAERSGSSCQLAI